MERYFMPRARAIALIAQTRKTVLSHANERLPADAKRLHDDAASLAQLLLDVRACRVDSFELTFPSPMHVTVCAD
jgi:hypothetical protein